MPETTTFQCSDETVNSYGFRVITDGIDTSQFEANPILLYMHQRGNVLGTWSNLKKNGGRLLADPNFDEEDPDAVKIQKKVAKKILRMASIGIEVLDYSEDPELMFPGQSLPTVTRCLLKEISIADIGSNTNALKLYDKKGNEIKIGEGLTLSEAIFNTNSENKLKNTMKKLIGLMMVLFASIGVTLTDAMSEEDIFNKIKDVVDDVKRLKAENLTLNDQIATFKEKEKLQTKERLIKLVDQAITDKKILPKQKDTYIELGTQNYKAVENLFKDMKPYEPVVTQLQNRDDPKKNWTFSDYHKKDPEGLAIMKKDNPEEYKRLYKEEYNIEPKI